MKYKLLLLSLLATLLLMSVAAAQDTTPEATPEATSAATPEATLPPGAMLEFPGAGGYTVRQDEKGIQRSYRVYIPTSYTESGDPVPLVLVLHGAGGNGANTESFVGFDALADQDNFVVAYPDGYRSVWNDGRAADRYVDTSIDDVQFLSDVIGFLKIKLNIDAQRVYAAGYSMGGMMSYRLACDLDQQVAAIASVASTMPIYLLSHCNNTPPLPVIVFQGTDDPIIPWTGIPNGYLSAVQTLGFWRSHNQCHTDFTIDALPDTDTTDLTRVMRQTLTGCAADVVLYSIYLGGHTWPGHAFSAGIDLGLTSQDIDATALIWQFFQDHPKAAVAATEQPPA